MERDRRWALARDIMAGECLDALVVHGDREAAAPAGFSPDCYFTNDRPGSIVVFVGDQPPRVFTFASLMIADHLQAGLRGDLQWIAPEQLWVGKSGQEVGRWLQQCGLHSARIGVLGLEPYPPFYFDGAMPARTLQGMQAAVPGAEFVPVYRAFFQRASVKSQEELALIAHAAWIGESMSEALRATARPGVSEAELVAAVTAACFSLGGYTAEVLLGSGPEYVGWGPPAWQYRAQPPRILRDGDLVLSEIFALYGLMETQHQAAVAIGEVHDDIHRAAAVARSSYEAGLSALRVGNTFGDVVDAMEAPLLEAGVGTCIRWSTASTPMDRLALAVRRASKRCRRPRAMRTSRRCRLSGANCPCRPACASPSNRTVHSAGTWPTSAVRSSSARMRVPR
ncbi:M24 family metallopeptidase [Stenotrophomonas maltophilia]|nr:M24 family metallopeptidase [Stenotrophomonas maltophilia]